MIIFLTICFRIILFFVGGILLTDALYLLLQGKIHIGIVLPLIMGIGFLFIALAWQFLHGYLAQHAVLQSAYFIVWGLFGIWLISFMVFIYQLKIHMQTQTQITSPVQAIIVLGSGVIQGQPSPTLERRLDRAAQLAKQQPQAWMVLSGGLDFAESQTEAQVMATYLQQKYGLSRQHMILEDQSTSTELNLKNSAVLLAQHQINKDMPIAIVTSDFHTIRAQAIARKQQYRHSIMFAAETPLQTRYNAWLREYFAFISGKILREY
ncbi:YdcF family protein [Acinetobacter sp. ANC 4641]|uniref:YdcF family protein n=1 Tax=Acinetobacter sp. ANC 4641 TaxID=2529847 RepID=UPI00103DD3F6|nr:YdcF family protein [Acinetobacter sp. ANC 4641]TCB11130.1 YdcF family protein [Acinetobacter sp. ANC 4641]